MSISKLTNVIIPASPKNYTKGRSAKISEITIHHMAGKMTAEQCGKIWQNPNRHGSSHYGIGYNGIIGSYVDESNTAWCNSNWASNCRAVSIETSNDKTGGDWHVSDASLNSLIKLVADIAKRHGLGKLVRGKNLTWHSMYASTACPGPYLKSKINYIIDEANKINGGKPSGNERIKSLQKALNKSGAGLVVDGSYGPLTTKAVKKYWNYKETIKWVQQTLNELGYNAGAVDGSRGPQTKSATRAYQKNNGLSVDGSAGPATIKSMAHK